MLFEILMFELEIFYEWFQRLCTSVEQMEPSALNFCRYLSPGPNTWILEVFEMWAVTAMWYM
jgi:hypothetical protein